MLTGALYHNNMLKSITRQTVNLIFEFVMESTHLQTQTRLTSPPQREEHYDIDIPIEKIFVLNLK